MACDDGVSGTILRSCSVFSRWRWWKWEGEVLILQRISNTPSAHHPAP